MSTNFPANDLKAPTDPPAGNAASGAAPTAAPDDGRLKKLEEQNELQAKALKDLQDQNQYLVTELRRTTNQPIVEEKPPVDPKTEWWTNPDEAFNRRMQPIINSFTASAEQLIRAEVAREFPKEFKYFGKEIDALMQQVDPRFRTQRTSWEYAINQVRGMHLKEYVTNPDLVVAFSEPATAGAGGSSPIEKTASEQLTDEERRHARSWGITDEQYLKRKNQQKVVR